MSPCGTDGQTTTSEDRATQLEARSLAKKQNDGSKIGEEFCDRRLEITSHSTGEKAGISK